MTRRANAFALSRDRMTRIVKRLCRRVDESTLAAKETTRFAKIQHSRPNENGSESNLQCSESFLRRSESKSRVRGSFHGHLNFISMALGVVSMGLRVISPAVGVISKALAVISMALVGFAMALRGVSMGHVVEESHDPFRRRLLRVFASSREGFLIRACWRALT